MKRYKHGDLVICKDPKGHIWKCACLLMPGTSIDKPKPVLRFMYGKWYGRNPLNYKSYGKVQGYPGDKFNVVYKIGHIKPNQNLVI